MAAEITNVIHAIAYIYYNERGGSLQFRYNDGFRAFGSDMAVDSYRIGTGQYCLRLLAPLANDQRAVSVELVASGPPTTPALNYNVGYDPNDPATVYVTTGYLNSQGAVAYDEPFKVVVFRAPQKSTI